MYIKNSGEGSRWLGATHCALHSSNKLSIAPLRLASTVNLTTLQQTLSIKPNFKKHGFKLATSSSQYLLNQIVTKSLSTSFMQSQTACTFGFRTPSLVYAHTFIISLIKYFGQIISPVFHFVYSAHLEASFFVCGIAVRDWKWRNKYSVASDYEFKWR